MLVVDPFGADLDAERATVLDEEFFQSRPLEYFLARIDALLIVASAAGRSSARARADFQRALGIPASEDPLPFGDGDRERQVAVDALAVRHHAAETLVRLLWAVAVARPGEGEAESVWVAVTDSPRSLHTTATEVVAALNGDRYLLPRLLLPPGTLIEGPVASAHTNALAWTQRAINLLTDDELDVNAAHNKVKHGLSVSARHDMRVDFVSDLPESVDGTVPLSALGPDRTTPLFERTTLTYLNRPYRMNHLEAVTLQVDATLTLAETWQMARVAGSIHHVAGQTRGRHTGDAGDCPALPLGPSPEQLLGRSVRGFRAPVTEPSGDRPAGVAFEDGSFVPLTFDYGSARSATIVND